MLNGRPTFSEHVKERHLAASANTKHEFITVHCFKKLYASAFLYRELIDKRRSSKTYLKVMNSAFKQVDISVGRDRRTKELLVLTN